MKREGCESPAVLQQGAADDESKDTCDDSQPLSHVPSGSLQLFGTLCVPSAAYPRSAKVGKKE